MFLISVPIVFALFLHLDFTFGAAESQNTISRLRKDLLEHYDPHSRPFLRGNKPTDIQLSFIPLHLSELDELRGIMTIEAYMELMWRDPSLVWVPEKYDGVKNVHFAESEIWKPDITVYESMGSEVDPWHNVYMVVNSSGYVHWNPPATLNVICALDFELYPKDIQECSLTVGSWSYHGELINIVTDTNETEITNSFMLLENTNPNWRVLSVTAIKIPNKYDVSEELKPPSVVEFIIKLERIGMAEEDLVALPRIMAIFVTLTMFLIPHGIDFQSIKMILGSTPLVILVILIFLVAMNVPTVSCLPNGLRALKATFALSSVALLVQVLLITVSSCNTRSAPDWMTRFLKPTWVNYALCFCGASTAPSATLQEDGTRVVESLDPRKKDWLMLASLLDRLFFVIFLFLFLVTGSFW